MPAAQRRRRYFEFPSLPAPIAWFVVAVLLSYFLAAEVAKHWFFRREGRPAPAVGRT